MAKRNLSGKDLLLYRGNGETTGAETFDLMACLESNDINQGSNTLTAGTKCGTLKLPGTKNASVSFSLIPYLDADATEVSLDTMDADYKSGTESGVVIFQLLSVSLL